MALKTHQWSMLFILGCLSSVGMPLQAADLSIAHVEITQGLQSGDNAIPMIRSKPTVVRVFPVITGSTDLPQTSALLHALQQGQELPESPLQPIRGTATAALAVDRQSDRSALVFELPPRWTTQDTDFWVELRPLPGFSDGDLTNNRYPQQGVFSVKFLESGRLDIRFLTIRFRKGGSDLLPEPRVTRRDAVSWLQAVFPIAPENVTYAPWLPTELVFENPSRPGQPGVEDLDGARLITELNTIWGTAATPDLLFAWTPTDSFSRNGRSDPWYRLYPFPPGMGRVAFGNSNGERYRRTLAHEAAHNLGINCHNLEKIPADVVGYDVNLVGPAARESALRLGATSGEPFFDIMKAGEIEANAWIVPWTYQHLLNALVSPTRKNIQCSTPPSPGAGEAPKVAAAVSVNTPRLLAIRGEIREDGGSFFPFYRVPAEGAFRLAAGTVPIGVQGTHEVRLLGKRGEALESIRWTPPFDQDDSNQSASSVPFTWFVPERDDIAAIVLLRGETRLASFVVEPGAPAIDDPKVGGVRQEAGFDGSPQELRTVTWNEIGDGPAGHPFDGRELRHRLWFSNNGGQSWIPVATNLSSADDGTVKVEINQSLLPGGKNCLFKVVTTDGYNETERTSIPFVLPDRPPRAEVVSPGSFTTVRQGTAVRLVATAFDPEEGLLMGNQLRWWSDLQDELGRGNVIEVPNLIPGIHQIHLTATDLPGHVSDPAIITVKVLPTE